MAKHVDEGGRARTRGIRRAVLAGTVAGVLVLAVLVVLAVVADRGRPAARADDPFSQPPGDVELVPAARLSGPTGPVSSAAPVAVIPAVLAELAPHAPPARVLREVGAAERRVRGGLQRSGNKPRAGDRTRSTDTTTSASASGASAGAALVALARGAASSRHVTARSGRAKVTLAAGTTVSRGRTTAVTVVRSQVGPDGPAARSLETLTGATCPDPTGRLTLQVEQSISARSASGGSVARTVRAVLDVRTTATAGLDAAVARVAVQPGVASGGGSTGTTAGSGDTGGSGPTGDTGGSGPTGDTGGSGPTGDASGASATGDARRTGGAVTEVSGSVVLDGTTALGPVTGAEALDGDGAEADALRAGLAAARGLAAGALAEAQRGWRNGSCVTVAADAPAVVATGSGARVQVTARTPDGATVKGRFSAVLRGPGSLRDGAADRRPARSRTFTLTAARQRGAVSRLLVTVVSVQGRATVAVDVATTPKDLRVDAAYLGGRVTGVRCRGPVGPWTLTLTSAGGAEAGEVGFRLGEDLTGVMRGSRRFPTSAGTITVAERGTVRYLPGSSTLLVQRLEGDTLRLPVSQGAFCPDR